MSQPKLILRPPPHRDFVQGFPGIAGAGSRPPAHVAGTVEVRLGTKGLKAAWLRIELRKLETLPGGESWGELIGRGPIDVWTATKDEPHKPESERGWELLQTVDFPFQVTIPEGLPPSAKVDKQAGIAYELVTSLCVQSKKGLLRKETTSSIIQNTHPLWLEKHELHSAWPVYSTPDDYDMVQDDVRVKVMRNQSCFGPGDSVDVRVLVFSERVSPLKLKNVSCAVRETITFKGSSKKSFGSNKAASQKTETLSTKSKSFGKKIYKGDRHTFDLACQIPRTHTLMSIQTAKHIEVSYTLRVQIETGKKPIIIDHLPITVSNFTRSASQTMVERIGYVAGLSGPAEDSGGYNPFEDGVDSSVYHSSGNTPTITRSMSFGGSTISGGRNGSSGYAGGDLRRRDTVMTQGTAISGPGMAGRGVPGQVFSWGQYGSAQPFGAAQPPRPAFAGPPSIFEGHDLAPEENRALFHSTNRPQSAMVLGTGIDPVLVPPSSYHGHSGAVTPIREGSEEGHHAGSSNHQHQQQAQYRLQQPSLSGYGALGYAPVQPPQRQRSLSNPSLRYPVNRNHVNSPSPGPQGANLVPQPHNARSSSYGAIASSQNGPSSAETEKERLYERARQQAERNQRRADERRGVNAGTSISSPASPVANGGRPYSMMNMGATSHGMSAEAEKARLFEIARAEAERYQSSFSQGAAFPASDATDPSSRRSSASQDPKRSSALYWTDLNQGQSSSSGSVRNANNVAQAAHGGQGTGTLRNAVSSSTAAPAPTTAPISTIVSGKPAPYPSYMSAEEEKRMLYERAKAEADAYQRGETAVNNVAAGGSGSAMQHSQTQPSRHQQTASSSTGTAFVPGEWPRNEPTGSVEASGSGSALAGSYAPMTSSSAAAPLSEKEQLRRYYEAKDAVAQRIGPSAAGVASESSGSGRAANTRAEFTGDPMYAPEVASAVHHATPHQPADTVPTPTRTTFSGLPAGSSATISNGNRLNLQPDLRVNTTVQSYLTEAEQQSAREKERLASHYARKTANAEARAAAKAAKVAAPVPVRPAPGYTNDHAHISISGPLAPPAVPVGPSAASEKAQLAAYYAAKDAVESNLQTQPQGSAQTIGGYAQPQAGQIGAGGGVGSSSIAMASTSGFSPGVAGSGSAYIPEIRATSPLIVPSNLASIGSALSSTPNGSSSFRPQAASLANSQWRPKYNSLYDDDDTVNFDEFDMISASRGGSGQGGAPPPPPLPPKIPISRPASQFNANSGSSYR
ncbi:hypothetical protein BCV70DRAFT_235625 [Testicularia cyperi]|uniref:Arrestin C-terminal-like domain-containing protein n=1 Tax=Testicularia cyperi TaxID=1882483 RepID=A0A317XXB6_9BASI|nr:hypothetical protein BCV70DRAFT_235625 [Testicularia cyperi]